MKVLTDVRHLANEKWSGVGNYTFEILKELSLDKSEVELLLFSLGKKKPRLPENLNLKHLSKSSRIESIRTLLSNHQTFRDYSKDVDLVFMPNLSIINPPKDKPYVLTIHDLSWRIYPQFFSKSMKSWHSATKPSEKISNAAAIIAPSESTKDDLIQIMGAKEEKIKVIHHGVTDSFNPEYDQDQTRLAKYLIKKDYVLFVGTLEPRKNIEALIKAVKNFRSKNNQDIELILVGQMGWSSKKIQKSISENQEWVRSLGYVSNQDLPALYRQAKAFIWPSIYEGFGMPVLEAMSCGAPVICSHTSSLGEITEDAALLIDPYNPNDITFSLEQIFSSKELRGFLKEKALSQSQKFSWQKCAKNTKELFKTVI